MCGKSLEGYAAVLLRFDGNVSNKSVPFVLASSSLLVSLSLHYNTDSVRNVTDTLRPKVLIEAYSDSNILGSHLLLSERLNFSDGPGSSLLKGTRLSKKVKCGCSLHVVESLVKVDGILTHDRALSVGFLPICLGHLVLCRWMREQEKIGKKLRRIFAPHFFVAESGRER